MGDTDRCFAKICVYCLRESYSLEGDSRIGRSTFLIWLLYSNQPLMQNQRCINYPVMLENLDLLLIEKLCSDMKGRPLQYIFG